MAKNTPIDWVKDVCYLINSMGMIRAIFALFIYIYFLFHSILFHPLLHDTFRVVNTSICGM